MVTRNPWRQMEKAPGCGAEMFGGGAPDGAEKERDAGCQKSPGRDFFDSLRRYQRQPRLCRGKRDAYRENKKA